MDGDGRRGKNQRLATALEPFCVRSEGIIDEVPMGGQAMETLKLETPPALVCSVKRVT